MNSQTESKLISLIMGSHFRPPAKQVLSILPHGTILSVEPEPDNPYDPNALRVYLAGENIPERLHDNLALVIGGTGIDLGEIIGPGAQTWLGYVGASGGKPLQKEGFKVGNQEFLDIARQLNSRGFDYSPTYSLTFAPSGAPAISMVWENPSA